MYHTYLSNIQVKFLIMPLVLLIDHGVVSEGEHSDPPSQKRKSDNGNPYLVICTMLLYMYDHIPISVSTTVHFKLIVSFTNIVSLLTEMY